MSTGFDCEIYKEKTAVVTALLFYRALYSGENYRNNQLQ